MKKIFLCLALSLSAAGTWAQSTAQIRTDFAARTTEITAAGIAEQLAALDVSNETRTALEFLYAYMPWPDVADYSADFFAAQTECALQARKELPWGSKVPEREWLHFVLPVRVNNENLDEFRTTCYEELRDRVKNLTMEQAVLEVNHWCHEHVTYKPSDSRTSSPLASMRTATGRCGEESTYTVAALRAVGIPARQVYTPRWAHTDDNHAWVEAWVDGKWCFLGACEPEAVLNLGWFNMPASRGMLMHTKVFGRYEGPEDIISRTACYTEINVTANYAKTTRTQIVVKDAAGKAVPSARVEYKIYNYGELYTVQDAVADADGRSSILTGLGDMVVWASHNGNYGFAKFTAGKDADVEVVLNHKAGDAFTADFRLVPPSPTNNIPAVGEEAAAANARRLSAEDSLRTAYVHTFATDAMADSVASEFGVNAERLRILVKKSCGNWQAVFDVVEVFPTDETLDLLESLSDKDLRDFSAATIQDHLQFVTTNEGDGGEIINAETDENGNIIGEAPAEDDDAVSSNEELSDAQKAFRQRYVYCPRIANEMLTGWRSYFAGAFKPGDIKDYKKDPTKFAKWIDKNIVSNPQSNPQGYCLSPAQAMETRRADVRNKGILFVAAMRSIGVPARIDEVTGKVQYVTLSAKAPMPTEQTANWQTINFAGQSSEAPSHDQQATLTLTYTPREHMENPGYYYHFTLSRIANGSPVLQNYDEGAKWDNAFSSARPIDAGDYLLTSGTRLADGTVLAHLNVFNAAKSNSVSEPLVMPEDKEGVQVIGTFNSENLYYDVAAQKEKSVLSTTGRGYYVIALIRANHEPTNHVLHDIEKLRSELEAWGRPLLMLFTSQDEYDRFQKNRAEFTDLPSTLSFGIDANGAVAADLFGSGLTKTHDLPLVVIADTFNRVLFASQGYTIGIGEQLKNTIGKLK